MSESFGLGWNTTLVQFGGATINDCVLQSKRVIKDQTGKSIYEVTFKDGTVMQYPEQSHKNESMAYVTMNEQGIADGLNIARFRNAQINSGASNKLIMSGTRDCNIDARNGKQNTIILEDDLKSGDSGEKDSIFRSTSNRVVGDINDNVQVVKIENRKTSDGGYPYAKGTLYHERLDETSSLWTQP